MIDLQTTLKPARKTDQVLVPSDGVRLVALWIRAFDAKTLMKTDSEAVAYCWRPEYECNPGEGATSVHHRDFHPQVFGDHIFNPFGEPALGDWADKAAPAAGESSSSGARQWGR